jgi:hypothetical protein
LQNFSLNFFFVRARGIGCVRVKFHKNFFKTFHCAIILKFTLNFSLFSDDPVFVFNVPMHYFFLYCGKKKKKISEKISEIQSIIKMRSNNSRLASCVSSQHFFSFRNSTKYFAMPTRPSQNIVFLSRFFSSPPLRESGFFHHRHYISLLKILNLAQSGLLGQGAVQCAILAFSAPRYFISEIFLLNCASEKILSHYSLSL